jgi:hippurate hydrolase
MDQIEAALRRLVSAACLGAGAPREPEVVLTESTYATVNSDEPYHRVKALHSEVFGDAVAELPVMITGSEDFAYYGLAGPARYPEPAIPTYFWMFGVTPLDVWAAAPGEELMTKALGVPSPHQPTFAPDPGLGLRRGVEALTVGVLAYLGKGGDS